MYPKLFEFEIFGQNIPVNSYGVMIVLGFVFAVAVISALGKKIFKPGVVIDMGVYTLFGGLLGGKLCYIILNWKEYQASWGIFNIFDGGLHPIGAIITGLIALFIIASKIFKRKLIIKIFSFKFLLLCLLVVTIAIAGSRIIYLALNRQNYDWDLFIKFPAGFVFYGGLVSGVITALICFRVRKIPVLKAGDAVAPGVMIGLSFGRIGCFLAGCCFGKKAEGFPLAVKFPEGAEVYRASGGSVFSVHPTQLYESVATFIIAIILAILYPRRKFDGQIFARMLVLYGAWRFFVEFLRGDVPTVLLGLTFSQWISIVAIISGLCLYLIWRKIHFAKTGGLVSAALCIFLIILSGCHRGESIEELTRNYVKVELIHKGFLETDFNIREVNIIESDKESALVEARVFLKMAEEAIYIYLTNNQGRWQVKYNLYENFKQEILEKRKKEVEDEFGKRLLDVVHVDKVKTSYDFWIERAPDGVYGVLLIHFAPVEGSGQEIRPGYVEMLFKFSKGKWYFAGSSRHFKLGK